MVYYNFLGVLEIIKGSIQILPKNGKIMASIATLGLLLYSSAFLGYFFIFKPLMAKNGIIPFTFWLLLLIIFVYVSRIINLSTVYVSAMSLNGQQVSFKNLYSRVKRSFQKRSISSQNLLSSTKIIWFILIITGTTILITLLMFFSNVPLVFVRLAWIVFAVESIVYLVYTMYISVARILAYVILVIEENCNQDEALTKAEGLVKEVKFDMFVLNIVASLSFLIVLPVYMIIAAKWPSNTVAAGIFLLCVAYLQSMFLFIAYTYLYFKCKESRGEEIMFADMLDYRDAANSPLLNESLP